MQSIMSIGGGDGPHTLRMDAISTVGLTWGRWTLVPFEESGHRVREELCPKDCGVSL